jgi:peptidoglycan/xylan/chitin deacetylase (PgdA/CDA1 family)
MYHYISDAPNGADRVRRDLSLSGADFELQLRYLANEGYHSVSLQDLVMHIQRGAALPERPIVLTFDDGYKDAYTVAFPLLKKYGFTGTFFVFTKPVDEENRDYLSWREIELMSAAGMEFGSHSYSHPDLKGKPVKFTAREIVDSRGQIEAHINRPVRFFCYPSGSYDKKVARAVKDAGYWGAVTIRQGIDHSADNLLELTRIRVRGGDGLERFDALLNFDW